MKNSKYHHSVLLLLQVLPSVSTETEFALKGGTAINLFLRDMPRLSVDIDLTYLPKGSREDSLDAIHAGLRKIKKNIESTVNNVKVTFVHVKDIPVPTSLNVQSKNATIKIETNLVLRGSVYPSKNMGLCISAQEEFEIYTDIQTLSDADIYGGKLCAALDRQHPRDLYDVMILLENEGITDEIRKAFIVYLASHSRPMNELLAPNWKNISEVFHKEFVGMTTEPVELSSLLNARDIMLSTLRKDLTKEEKQFLISMKDGTPDWNIL
jgi:predicted nucleotidyltransferase component of viral defense system